MPSEKSIWRSIMETLLYVKPKNLIPSLHRKAISMYDLKTEPLPRTPEIVHSHSLTNSQMCLANEFLIRKSSEVPKINSNRPKITFEEYPDDYRIDQTSTIRNHQITVKDPNTSLSNKATKYGTFSNHGKKQGNTKFSGMRKRSQSIGCTGIGHAAHIEESAENEYIDLDSFLSIPPSEQFKKEHYTRRRTFSEKRDASSRMSKLQLPCAKSTFSDDDDLTPKVEYSVMKSKVSMFRKSDPEYYEDDVVFQ